MTVSRETSYASYADVLHRWNAAIQLVGPNLSQGDLRSEITECLALVPHIPPTGAIDLGSGNGLPVIPLSIELPCRPFTAIESDQRKAAFLNAARRSLGLANLTVISDRVEAVAALNAETITARAFAPLERLIGLARRHLRDGGRLVLLKGGSVQDEIVAAQVRYTFDYDVIPLRHARGVVLVLEKIELRT